MQLHGKALQHGLFILPMLLFLNMLRAAVTLWRHYNFRKFDADIILHGEIQFKKMEILML